jgi:hypothetical protein
METNLYDLMYVSVAAQSIVAGGVGLIAREARAKNAMIGITGLLVYDGESFCQFLEGSADQVELLFKRIRIDVRHEQVHLVYEGSSKQRRFPRFSMAFAQTEGDDVLRSFARLAPEEAMAHFWNLVPGFEMEP